MATCTQCGAELKPGAKFCENCGAKVSAPKPAAQPTAVPQPPVQPTQAAPGAGAQLWAVRRASVRILLHRNFRRI